MELFQIVYCV